MNTKLFNIILFLLTGIALLISLVLFWNMAIYVDENNASPIAIHGGYYGLYLNWIRLLLLAALVFLTGLKLLLKKRAEMNRD